METTKLYQINHSDNDTLVINELDVFVLTNPLTGRKIYMFEDDDVCVSYFESELNENDYFTTKESANEYILNENKIKKEFIKICEDFIANCKIYGYENPFTEIAEYKASLEVKEFVNNIEDQTFRFYAKNNIWFPSYLSSVSKYILDKIEQTN